MISRTIKIDFDKDFLGTIAVRITATGMEVTAVDAVSPVPDEGIPAWGAEFLAMFERFERYTKASPCRLLAAAMVQAGWSGTVPPAKGGKPSQPYIRWEHPRGPAAKPLVVYQHSKKLATLTGTPSEESFYENYLEKGVGPTMVALGDFASKMIANS